MSFKNEAILSRKIAITSVSRHFAGWKIRYFSLDKENQVLDVVTEGSKRTVVELRSASITMGRHHYSADEYHWFWIKYFDNSENCMKELIMKFEHRSDMERWEQALKEIHTSYQQYLHESVPLLLSIFGGLVREKKECQAIVQKDEELDGQEATYYIQSPDKDELSENGGKQTLMDSFMAATAGDDTSTIFSPTETNSSSNMNLQISQYGNTQLSPQRSGVPRDSFSPRIEPISSYCKIDNFYKSLSKSTDHCNIKNTSLPKLSVPKLNILIMAVGTRGDIQPFRQFGVRLKEDGHRVRLATHELFRSYVLEKELEFYPLAGDPILLSEFMVKTGGSILPLSSEILKEVPKFHAMICEIISSAWCACLEPDPQDEAAKPFAADVIISNPVTYAHCHCAEALGIPLHLMFPQPWVPTKAFPHPLSRLSYSKNWHAENFVSYEIVDRAMWLTFERDLNQFRSSVGLEAFRLGQYGWNLLNYHQIPFVKMWSPSIVPKPKDWPAHVDIVGSFFDIPPSAAPVRNNGGRLMDRHSMKPSLIKPLASFQTKPSNKLSRSRLFDPKVHSAKLEDSLLPVALEPKEVSPELMEFLEKPGFIIYVGFGSMVVPNLEELVALFLEAAALTKVRLLFQQGWSKIDTNRFEMLAKIAQEKAERIQLMINSGELDKNGKNDKKDEAEIATNHLEASAEVVSGDASITSTETKKSESAHPSPQQVSSGWLFNMLQNAVPLLSGSNISNQNNTSAMSFSATTKAKEKLNEWDELLPETTPTIPAKDAWNWETDAFYMAECPHTWLFQQVSAVVHHGGAGTTSTGLRYGRPTWVCPFFGDQFFWGEMIYRDKLGPKPCPVGKLDIMAVVSAFEVLRKNSTQVAAEAVGMSMAREDGVENAVRAFYQHLPLEHMVCEVSLMMNIQNNISDCHNNSKIISLPTELAQVYCVQCGLKMTQEIADFLHTDASKLHMQDHQLLPCCYFDWSVPKPGTATEGVMQGVGGYIHELIEGVVDVVYDPVQGGMQNGFHGAATGLVKGLNTFVDRQLQGGAVLVEKIVDGVMQSGTAEHNDDLLVEEYQRGQMLKTSSQLSVPQNGGLLGQATSVASGWLKAGATVIAAAAAANATKNNYSNGNNSGWYDMSSPTSSVASPHITSQRSPKRNNSKPKHAKQPQHQLHASSRKKPVRFINHQASAKTMEIRRLRTSIHQQIRRLQQQAEDCKASQNQAELNINTNGSVPQGFSSSSSHALFPNWSQEHSSDSIVVTSPAQQVTSSDGLYALGGAHNQSFIIHNSSFGGASFSSSQSLDSFPHHGISSINRIQSHNSIHTPTIRSSSQNVLPNSSGKDNDRFSSQFGALPPLAPTTTGTPTRRSLPPPSSSTLLMGRGISATVTETILERSRESEETAGFSPFYKNTNNGSNHSDHSDIMLPAILCQGSINDALKASILVNPIDPFETEDFSQEKTEGSQTQIDENSINSDKDNVPNLKLPSPLPPLSSSTFAGFSSLAEASDHQEIIFPSSMLPVSTSSSVTDAKVPALDNKGIMQSVAEDNDSNEDNDEAGVLDDDDMPFLLRPPAADKDELISFDVYKQNVEVNTNTISPPNLLHFGQDSISLLNTSNEVLATSTDQEPSLLDMSQSKLAQHFRQVVTIDKNKELIVSHDLLGLISKTNSTVEEVVNRVVSGDNTIHQNHTANKEKKETVAKDESDSLSIVVSPPKPNDAGNKSIVHSNSSDIVPEASEPSPFPIPSVPSLLPPSQAHNSIPGETADVLSSRNGDESPLFVTSRVPSLMTTPFRGNDSSGDMQQISNPVVSGTDCIHHSHSGYSLGLLESSDASDAKPVANISLAPSLASFPSFPAMSNTPPQNLNKVTEVFPIHDQTTHKDKAMELSSMRETGFHRAKAALRVFERLSGSDRETFPATCNAHLTRIWSERRFATVLRHAIARYEAHLEVDEAPLLLPHASTTARTAMTAAASDNHAAFMAMSDNRYAGFVSPPMRSMSKEEASVRRPEHREALLKHLLKTMTRDHNVLTFADFVLFYRSLIINNDDELDNDNN